MQPSVLLDRDADKRWTYENWLAAASASGVRVPPPTTAASKARAPFWAVAVKEVALEGGVMSFSDRAGSKPVTFELCAVNTKLGSLVPDDRLASQAQGDKPMLLSASLQLATRRFEPGKVKFNGNFGLTPLQVNGQLQLDRLPVQAFEPYFADALNIELLRADASFKGRVAYRQSAAGPIAQVTGDAAIEELKANSLVPNEDLLDWKALNLRDLRGRRGLSVAMEPTKASRVEVKETVLNDFSPVSSSHPKVVSTCKSCTGCQLQLLAQPLVQ